MDTYRVVLPGDSVPKFPEVDILDPSIESNRSVLYVTHRIGVHTFLVLFGKWKVFKIPTTKINAMRLAAKIYAPNFIFILLAMILIPVVYPYMSGLDGFTGIWLGVMVVSVLLLPFHMLRAFFPPPIDVTVSRTKVALEFSSLEYAEMFAEKNQAEVEFD